MLRKLFHGIKMTWPRVILFAVVTGVFTGLMALLAPDGSSFRQIAVTFEAWILFAIIIICNCDTPLEAALKTFVFFLISQPLVYLVQVPFNSMGFGLFQYYRYWFIITLLTFPGAFLGWFIKKDSILSALILSVMLVLLVWLGVGYLDELRKHFPKFLVAAVFCFAAAGALIFGVLRSRGPRLTAAAISAAALIAGLIYIFSQPFMNINRLVDLDHERYPVDESWTVEVADEKISTASFIELGDEYDLMMYFYEPEPNEVILRDGDGNEYRLTVTCSRDFDVTVEEAPPR